MNTPVNTTAPLQPSAVTSERPEWLRIPEATRRFGLSRSLLYSLITQGAIKSTCLRKRGAVRGVRLISYDSLSAYISASADEQAPTTQP